MSSLSLASLTCVVKPGHLLCYGIGQAGHGFPGYPGQARPFALLWYWLGWPRLPWIFIVWPAQPSRANRGFWAGLWPWPTLVWPGSWWEGLEPTTNLTHIRCCFHKLRPSHLKGNKVLSPLHEPVHRLTPFTWKLELLMYMYVTLVSLYANPKITFRASISFWARYTYKIDMATSINIWLVSQGKGVCRITCWFFPYIFLNFCLQSLIYSKKIL